MCLNRIGTAYSSTGRKKFPWKLRTAKKAIKVLKFLERYEEDEPGLYRSPYKGAPYRLGDLYESALGFDAEAIQVETGLHSYALPDEQWPYEHVPAEDSSRGRFYVAEIPKGAKYIVGGFCGDLCYASTQLRVLHEYDANGWRVQQHVGD